MIFNPYHRKDDYATDATSTRRVRVKAAPTRPDAIGGLFLFAWISLRLLILHRVLFMFPLRSRRRHSTNHLANTRSVQGTLPSTTNPHFWKIGLHSAPTPAELFLSLSNPLLSNHRETPLALEVDNSHQTAADEQRFRMRLARHVGR